jgi:trehalose 6-phosphate synthase
MRPDHTAGIAYEAVNRLFAKEIASHVRNDDVIWIHDYHLMLLPQYLREELGDSVRGVKIGFFLHTPFPGSDIWKDVPMSADLLKGLLGADLIGFHTDGYVKNFEECCRDIL